MMPHSYSVFGGDARQTYLASLLEQSGLPTVHTTDMVRFLEVVVLPIPTVTPDGVLRGTRLPFETLLQAAPAGTVFWGSGFSPYRPAAEALGHLLCDFGDFPAFAEENAVPTAEGAIQLAMEELPVTIQGGSFLVIGYGRIGKALAARLDALGGSVTVASRSEPEHPYRRDRTGAYALPLSDYDAVFNTAPGPVLSQADCRKTREDCLLIDLASAPGGIAKDCGRRLIHALGLPAKVAPKTAARILRDILLKEMEESLWNSPPSASP